MTITDATSSGTPGHLERIRYAELEPLRQRFVKGMRVLELGGGSGYQASILHSWGRRVTSLEIPGCPEPATRYYTVETYDGAHLPFPDGSFDVVFSSNVLEHVAPNALPALCRETRRVLCAGGRGAHILPSPAWRLWTSLAHYPFLARAALGYEVDAGKPSLAPASDLLRRRGLSRFLRSALVAPPHGEYSSALAELYYFSRRRWTRVFHEAGFIVMATPGAGLFYTGYHLADLSLRARQRLASVLGSACRVFILCPR